MNCTLIDELIFVLSFVSSYNTNVKTTDQFILLYTRYVCDFSGLTNFSQKLCELKENILAFDSRWILWCLPRKKASPQDCLLIPNVNYQTVYPVKLFLWLPVRLLASEKVVSFFICEEVFGPEVVLHTVHRAIRLESKFALRMPLSWLILERTKFGRNKIVFVIKARVKRRTSHEPILMTIWADSNT